MSASSSSGVRHEDASSLVWPFVVIAFLFVPSVFWYFVVVVPLSWRAAEFMKDRFLEADAQLRMALSGETTPQGAIQSIEDLACLLKWAGFFLPIPIIPLTFWAGHYFTSKVEDALA